MNNFDLISLKERCG